VNNKDDRYRAKGCVSGLRKGDDSLRSQTWNHGIGRHRNIDTCRLSDQLSSADQIEILTCKFDLSTCSYQSPS
jgi:hypothetical protein